jgi:hypothetical protein
LTIKTVADTLGTRLPWRVTLSSSDPVPCALSFFVAARTTLIRACQQFEADNLVIRFFYYFSAVSAAS